MSFDAIPEDKQESYKCQRVFLSKPDCEGNITKDASGVWICDTCNSIFGERKVDNQPYYTFSDALKLIMQGKTMTRLAFVNNDAPWGMKVQIPDEHSKMTEPYLYIEKTVTNDDKTTSAIRCPYIPTFGDLFADDWVVV